VSARRAITLVAQREIVERVRQRSFVISTVVTLAIVAAAAVLPGLIGGGGPERYRVGVVGEASQPVAQAAVVAATRFGVEIAPERVAARPAAERALEADELDAVIVGGRTLLSSDSPPDELEQALQAGAQRAGSVSVLRDRGLSAGAIERALSPPALATRTLEAAGTEDEQRFVALAAVLLLYIQLLTYGLWVAAGVVEEKASRVVEILLAAIAPRELLAGKVIGLGLLGLAQLLLVVAVGAGLALASGTLEVESSALATIGVVLLWFPLGYALYASLYAAAGALVSRQEDLQSSSGPLTLIVIAAYLVSFQAIDDPAGGLARIASLVPFTAPLVQPVRLVTGEGSLVSALAAVAIIAITTLVIVRVAATIYERAVLRTGKPVRLREALRR
jgi:ABC-2 type transport system permease protein